MDRDINDVSLIRYINRLSIPAGHSPIFYKQFLELSGLILYCLNIIYDVINVL